MMDKLTADITKEENTKEFYKKFYEENRVAILQYNSLRENFNKMVKDVLGNDYYNMAMDVYEADKDCCEDITNKANEGFFKKILNWWG